MKVTVKLFASLQKDRFNEKIIDFDDGVTLGEIINKINISKDDFHISFVNGCQEEPDVVISEGDVVSLFPPVGGG